MCLVAGHVAVDGTPSTISTAMNLKRDITPQMRTGLGT